MHGVVIVWMALLHLLGVDALSTCLVLYMFICLKPLLGTCYRSGFIYTVELTRNTYSIYANDSFQLCMFS